ncbi:MAG: hypothetical protein D6722_07495 [Bacteroidetes bacterium]|nr:MAG: hypothetical protein D6722_07495 [Bacteroidota bacterium]
MFPPVAGEASWARSFPVVVHPTWEVRQHILSLQVRLSEARPLSFHIDRLDGQTMFARRLTPAGTTYAGETDLSALPNGLYVLHLKAGGQIRSRLILL